MMSAKQKRIRYLQFIYLVFHASSIGLGVDTFEKKLGVCYILQLLINVVKMPIWVPVQVSTCKWML